MSHVSFIDFLGGSDIFASLTDQTSRDLEAVIAQASKDLRGTALADLQLRYLWFTDNVGVFIPINPVTIAGRRTTALELIIEHIAVLQRDLILAGYFPRGALATGFATFVSTDTHTFLAGRPVLEAYHHESKIAEVPRISLAESTLHLLANRPAEELPLLRDPSDGEIFIDYLTATLSRLPPRTAADFLNTHGASIAMAYRSAGDPVKRKYLWLAAYHAFAERSILGRPPRSPLVPGALKIAFSRPSRRDLVDHAADLKRRFPSTGG